LFRRIIRPAITGADLPRRLRLHDLRHRSAALLISLGAHPKAIQERLGHSSITVTLDVYGHLFPSVDEALTERLDQVLEAGRDAARPERASERVVAPVDRRGPQTTRRPQPDHKPSVSRVFGGA
jgi:integrase